MRAFRASFLGAFGAAALLSQASPASAAAFAGIEENSFSLLWYNARLPDGTWYFFSDEPGLDITLAGVSVSVDTQVIGNAQVHYSFYPGYSYVNSKGRTFYADIAGEVTAQPSGYAYLALTLTTTLRFENNTGHDFLGIEIQAAFSAFNPGSSHIGASVDNTSTEFARYQSYQTGLPLGDNHSCDTRIPGSSYYWSYTPPSGASCGVSSPDHSLTEFGFSDFASGAVEYRTFSLTLIAEASSVPEPSSAALGGTALLGVWSAARWGSRRAARHPA